jgi:hypothetical protein
VVQASIPHKVVPLGICYFCLRDVEYGSPAYWARDDEGLDHYAHQCCLEEAERDIGIEPWIEVVTVQ